MCHKGLNYWYREGPTDSYSLPLLFFHGIAPGLLMYVKVIMWLSYVFLPFNEAPFLLHEIMPILHSSS